MSNDTKTTFKMKFNADDYYDVTIEDGKVVVYSECCTDTMSDETARALYAELHKIYGGREVASEWERCPERHASQVQHLLDCKEATK